MKGILKKLVSSMVSLSVLVVSMQAAMADVIENQDIAQTGPGLIIDSEYAVSPIIDVEKITGGKNVTWADTVPDNHAKPCILSDFSSAGLWSFMGWLLSEAKTTGSYVLNYDFYTDSVAVPSNLISLMANCTKVNSSGYSGDLIPLLGLSNGNLKIGNTVTSYTYSPNTWYNVQAEIRPSDHTFDLYINGNMIAAGEKLYTLKGVEKSSFNCILYLSDGSSQGASGKIYTNNISFGEIVPAVDIDTAGTDINLDGYNKTSMLEVATGDGFTNTSSVMTYPEASDVPEGCPGEGTGCIKADIPASSTWAWQTWKLSEGMSAGKYTLSYNFYISGSNLQANLLGLKQGEKDNGKDGYVIDLLGVSYDGFLTVNGSDTMYEYTKDKWYEAVIVIDVANRLYDVYVNGHKIAEDETLSRTSFTSVYFMAMNQSYTDRTGQIYVSDINLDMITPVIDTQGTGINLNGYIVNKVFEVEKNTGNGNNKGISYTTAPNGHNADGACLVGHIDAGTSTWAYQTWDYRNYPSLAVTTGKHLLHYDFYISGDNIASDLIAPKNGEKENGEGGAVRYIMGLGYDGNITMIDGVNKGLQPTQYAYSKNTWYSVDILINTSTNLCDIYVNGHCLAKDRNMGASSFTSLYFEVINEQNVSYGGDVYVDHVSLSDLTPIITMYNTRFTDNNGNAISAVGDSGVNFTGEIINRTEKNETLNAFAALYDKDGNLKSVSVETKELTKYNRTQLNMSIDSSKIKAGDYVSVYLWYNGSIGPVCKKAVLSAAE